MTHPAFAPAIAPEIIALLPDFKALCITARNLAHSGDAWVSSVLAEAAQGVAAMPPWGAAHLADWAEAYRGFGAKPQRTPCSVEALIKRAQRDCSLPSINAVVDLYNAVSVKYVLPIGGEDMDNYVGNPRLLRAGGSETFETMKEGQAVFETVDKGEVVWRDDVGVTCRRWNWRQSTRTRVTETSSNVWFVLEALGAMPLDAMVAAGRELTKGLLRLSPGAEIQSTLIKGT